MRDASGVILRDQCCHGVLWCPTPRPPIAWANNTIIVMERGEQLFRETKHGLTVGSRPEQSLSLRVSPMACSVGGRGPVFSFGEKKQGLRPVVPCGDLP
jgi:hypothetical protein